MTKQEYFKLLAKYESGLASPEEERLLYAYYNLFSLREDGLQTLNELQLDQLGSGIKKRITQRILAGEIQRRPARLWPRIAGVAAAVAAIVFGVWFYTREVASSRKAPRNDVAYKNDVAPGKNTATLTLANGKTINLSDAKTGVVVGANKLAYNDGTVVDPLTGSPNPSLRGGTTRQPHTSDEIASSQNAPRNDGLGGNDRMQLLTASTPRGGQYQITLPDGTRVWLNADSKISFPAQFIGKERKILLVSGEAYFEVATSYTSLPGTSPSLRGRRTKQSFIVESNGQEVEVLGTHFNINAYSDEGSTKTTLLEGSVRVSSSLTSSLRGGTTRQSHHEVATSRRAPRNDDRNSNDRNNDDRSKGGDPGLRGDDGLGNSEVLKPGQQAVLTANTNQFKVTETNVNDAVSWKNGLFSFKDASIQTVMRQLARWYDVEVVYEGKPTNSVFTGEIYRNITAQQALKLLAYTNVKFKIEGKKIIVTK
jgi:transmembrane sensor